MAPCPFKTAKTPENVFFADANDYTADGKYIVTWAFNYTPAVDDWRAGVVDALTQYTVNGGSWDDVKTAFVDGWATQYAKENRLSYTALRCNAIRTGGGLIARPRFSHLRRTELLAGMDRARAPGTARKKHR